MTKVIGFLGKIQFDLIYYVGRVIAASGASVAIVNRAGDKALACCVPRVNRTESIQEACGIHFISSDNDEYWDDYQVVLLVIGDDAPQDVLDVCSSFVYSTDLLESSRQTASVYNIYDDQRVVCVAFAKRKYKKLASEFSYQLFGKDVQVCMVPFDAFDFENRFEIQAAMGGRFKQLSAPYKEAIQAILIGELPEQKFRTAFRKASGGL